MVVDGELLGIVLLVDTPIAAAELDTDGMSTEVLSVKAIEVLVGIAGVVDGMSVVVVFLKTLRDVLIVELVDIDTSDGDTLSIGWSVEV